MNAEHYDGEATNLIIEAALLAAGMRNLKHGVQSWHERRRLHGATLIASAALLGFVAIDRLIDRHALLREDPGVVATAHHDGRITFSRYDY